MWFYVKGLEKGKKSNNNNNIKQRNKTFPVVRDIQAYETNHVFPS